MRRLSQVKPVYDYAFNTVTPMKLPSLILFFAVTAFLYASVGFGGGSTYTALLVLSKTDYSLIPIIALSCNIAVVSGNTIRYSRNDLVPWSKLWPFLLTSVPMAWIGGRIEVTETLFVGLLAVALFLAGIRLFRQVKTENVADAATLPTLNAMCIGGGIGLYSGIVGIGGGIFLAPILYALNWGRAKTISAACSVFILLNSASGFLGQFIKLSDANKVMDALNYWPLLIAVIIGGCIGNYIGVTRLSQSWVQKLTGILILFVACRLTFELLGRVT